MQGSGLLSHDRFWQLGFWNLKKRLLRHAFCEATIGVAKILVNDASLRTVLEGVSVLFPPRTTADIAVEVLGRDCAVEQWLIVDVWHAKPHDMFNCVWISSEGVLTC